MRSYTNWNRRTPDEKTQAEEYKHQKANKEKKCRNRKVKFSKLIKVLITNQIIRIIWGIMISIFILLCPVNFTESKLIHVTIVCIKIAVISVAIIKQIGTEPLVALCAISFIGFGIWVYSLNISQKKLLEMVIGTKWEFQNSFFIFICSMITVWIYLSLRGTKKYSNKKKRDKIKFVICMCFEYVFTIGIVISVYANLYMAYHDEIYYKFQMDLLGTQGENISLHRKKIEKEIDGKTWIIDGMYDEQDKEKVCPLDIMIQDEEGKIGIIEPDLNTALNSESIGSANYEKYYYFSFGTFFSSGYGDIYPISSITRNWAMQEMIISNILMVFLIPILITSVQEFIQKQQIEE